MSARQKWDLANVIVWFVLAVSITGRLQWLGFLGLLVAVAVQLRGLGVMRRNT